MSYPAHYDIHIVPGQLYNNPFISPDDYSGETVEFHLDDRAPQSTANDTLLIEYNTPSLGKTMITPILTPAETLLITENIHYELRLMTGTVVKEELVEGEIVPVVP